MGTYKTKYNPFSKSLQYVLDANLLKIKGSVDTVNDLPLIGNAENDCYITKDTDRLYTWTISESSGLITDWKDVGSTAEIDWSAITNKPSSSVADIDDAVSKKHNQGTDTTLGAMTEDLDMNDHSIVNLKDDSIQFKSGGSITKVDYDDAISKKHTQNTDTILDNNGIYQVTAREIIKVIYNLAVVSFYLAIETGRSLFNLIDGIVDEYSDESGIDTDASINEDYFSEDDYYAPENEIDSYTKLMLHLNGVDGATNTTDASDSAHTVTFHGDAQLDDAQKKFGDTSALFNRAGGSALVMAPSADWNFGAEDFTIDTWLKRNSFDGAPYSIVGQVDSSGSPEYLHIRININGTISVVCRTSTGSTLTLVNTVLSIIDTNWHHLAVVRNGNVLTVFVDGVADSNTLDLTGITLSDNSSYNFVIGSHGDQNSFAFWTFGGWMDEFRVSKGIARWTSNFTPMIREYGDYLNLTLISEAFDADLVPSNARLTLLEEDIDEVTLNTDLLSYISRDGGTTWTQATLEKEDTLEQTKQTLISYVDISAQPSGTDMRYKIETANNKSCRIHATSLMWD